MSGAGMRAGILRLPDGCIPGLAGAQGTAFSRTGTNVVNQRVHTGGGDIRVGGEVGSGIEKGVGIAALGRSMLDEMDQRVQAGIRYV